MEQAPVHRSRCVELGSSLRHGLKRHRLSIYATEKEANRRGLKLQTIRNATGAYCATDRCVKIRSDTQRAGQEQCSQRDGLANGQLPPSESCATMRPNVRVEPLAEGKSARSGKAAGDDAKG